MKKCIVDGQKEPDISKLGLKNEAPLPLRVYTYKIKKPSERVKKVVFNGIQSSLAFAYTISTDVLVNNVIPDNVLVGKGIPVPKYMIKTLPRKDRGLKRETKNAYMKEPEYDKMKAQERKKIKWLRQIERQRG